MPDVAFSLEESGEAGDESAPRGSRGDEDARLGLHQRIVAELATVAPAGWERLTAEFAVTAVEDRSQAVFFAAEGERVLEPPRTAVELVRDHRAAALESETERWWWRMLVTATADGAVDVEYDYGAQPFPDWQLMPPEAYRADMEQFPRQRLPVWLAAYVGHGDRQTRPPRVAAESARADRAAQVWPTAADDFPALPQMWARWAALSAAFVAAGSAWGPRIQPSLGWFESARQSGATLYRLPGGRAVLSGGVWDAPTLEAVYNGGADMPDFFAGAPEWVADPVLNGRAGAGLLSFCYWWESGSWFRAESPSAEDCAKAVPGVWTTAAAAAIIARLAGGERLRQAMAMVSAAESGSATRDAVADVFDGDDHDVDGAMFQLRVAGLASDPVTLMPRERALDRVRRYVRGRGLDTARYPLDSLAAERLECGWMVYAPVPEGKIAIGRAIYYVADDGVLEPSSSSTPPARYAAGFADRFRERRTATFQAS